MTTFMVTVNLNVHFRQVASAVPGTSEYGSGVLRNPQCGQVAERSASNVF
jgi:hypothetical protein